MFAEIWSIGYRVEKKEILEILVYAGPPFTNADLFELPITQL